MRQSTRTGGLVRWAAAGVALAVCLGAVLAVVTLSAAPAAATFPGRDGKIVFARANQVYTINANGTGVTKITSAGKNYQPAWSPDGKRIAYINETTAGVKDIWVMQANGTGKTRVTNLGVVYGPSFSADGRWIAFGGMKTGAITGPVLMRIRSTAPFAGLETLLGATYPDWTDPADLETMPASDAVAWSTGREIWWYSPSYPSSPDHYIIQYNIDTKYYNAYFAVGGACCGFGSVRSPAVSADNTRIGWTYLNGDSGDGLPRIVIYPRPFGPQLPFASVAHDDQLAFSPSGTRVALVNDATGTARIFTANADGSGRKLLTSGYQPDWQPLP